MNYVVFTDLDGTLLNHHDYSFADALPEIERLKSANIEIVPVTSKTRAELEPLRSQIGLTSPFIIENGAAVYFPTDASAQCGGLESVGSYCLKAFSEDHAFWRRHVAELTLLIPNAFAAFSQMSVEDISELTGLSLLDAKLAAQREYSDPLHWFGNEQQFRTLEDYCSEQEIKITRGGRFVHLLKGADKGSAVRWFVERLPERVCAIALGDGENDLPMLSEVDYPVQIKSDVHEFPEFKHPNLYRTAQSGAKGWAEAIKKLVNHS
jgi:mannosyl-3-phosphoglycerate phosphatase